MSTPIHLAIPKSYLRLVSNISLEIKIHWAKRRFEWAEYAPYQDKLEKLLMANATQYREFMMFSMEQKVGLSDVYVGVPSAAYLAVFDGFERVAESDLPKFVDTLLVADANAFKERFEFTHNKRKTA